MSVNEHRRVQIIQIIQMTQMNESTEFNRKPSTANETSCLWRACLRHTMSKRVRETDEGEKIIQNAVDGIEAL